MIKFQCPGCPIVYSVDDDKGWQTGECPTCRAAFTIPGDPPDRVNAALQDTRVSDEASPRKTPNRDPEKIPSKRIVAGVLALCLGAFGVHKFVLGYTRAGLIHLLLTLATCGLMKFVAIVEGIIYLTKSDAEFVSTYQIGTKEWF